MSRTAQHDIVSVRPHEQTCLRWARGEACPPDRPCPHPHHFYPTITWRSLPGPTSPGPAGVDASRPATWQLKSTRCPLWPSHLCPWSTPDLCPYAHETSRSAEQSVMMQDAARHLCERDMVRAVVRLECGGCGRAFADGAWAQARQHWRTCWKRRVKMVWARKSDGAAGRPHARRSIDEEQMASGARAAEWRPLRDLIGAAWADIEAAQQAHLWPRNAALRSSAAEYGEGRGPSKARVRK